MISDPQLRKLLFLNRICLGLLLFGCTGGLSTFFVWGAFSIDGLWRSCLFGFMAVFFLLQALAVWRILLFRPRERPLRKLFAPTTNLEMDEELKEEYAIPVERIDPSKRYDIQCQHVGEHRTYEDVRLVCIRSFEPPQKFGSALIGGFLEIEDRNGTRMMIQRHGIVLICEHGARPSYKTFQPGPGAGPGSGG